MVHVFGVAPSQRESCFEVVLEGWFTTPPKFNVDPEKWWLEDDGFLSWSCKDVRNVVFVFLLSTWCSMDQGYQSYLISARTDFFDSHRIHGTGIFTYICLIYLINVGKYTILGYYGIELFEVGIEKLFPIGIQWPDKLFFIGIQWPPFTKLSDQLKIPTTKSPSTPRLSGYLEGYNLANLWLSRPLYPLAL